MKSLIAFASVVALSVVPAFAAEGQVSHQSLNKMGLSGMKAMTDAQGTQIRGLSIAVVAGGTKTTLPGADAGSTFLAAGSGKGTHYATGSSDSESQDSLSVSSGHHTTTITITAAAATTASAKAH
jgi:hypothetical protein